MQIKSLPLVTIIIPTKNRLSLLKNALKSVYEQSYQNTEIIVIDVCSDDGTADFLKEETKRKGIKVYTSKVPVLAGAARNIGIKEATGDLVAFLDDDDEWLPEKLEKQVPLFNKPGVGLVYTGAKLINIDQNIIYIVAPQINGDVFEELLIENKIGTTNTVVLKAEIAKELLFDISFPAREEYDLWLRVAKTHKIAGVPLPMVKVYSRNTLSRISSDVGNYVTAIDLLNDKYSADIDGLPEDKRIQRKAAQFFFLASQSVKANNVSLARSYYLKSLQAKFSIKAAGSFAASFFGIKAILLMRKLKG
jgi:glycosyltransferase involved in cell wall biosynthesis